MRIRTKSCWSASCIIFPASFYRRLGPVINFFSSPPSWFVFPFDVTNIRYCGIIIRLGIMRKEVVGRHVNISCTHFLPCRYFVLFWVYLFFLLHSETSYLEQLFNLTEPCRQSWQYVVVICYRTQTCWNRLSQLQLSLLTAKINSIQRFLHYQDFAKATIFSISRLNI